MFDDSIRGGQIFIHQLRMFKQILKSALVAALFCGIIGAAYLNLNSFEHIDWHAALNYWCGVAIYFADIALSIPFPNSPQMSINVAKLGASHLIPIREFMIIGYYSSHGFNLLKTIGICFAWAIAISGVVLLLIFWGWSRFGKFAKETKLLKGNRILSEKEVYSYLKAKDMLSDLYIDNLPLVKDSETKHILITGSTGSGKSNCLHLLLPQIRQKGQSAIVVDTEGTMIERYYRPGKDIIINPFDARSHSWDFWQEVADERLTEKVASSFFPELPGDSYSGEKRWNSWGKMLFLGAIEYLKNNDERSLKSLFELIHKEELATLVWKLKETEISGLLDSKSDHNAAPHNIRMNTMEATRWLKYFNTTKKQSISFRQWFTEFDARDDDQWIFISSSRQDTEFMLPFFSTIMDIALSSLIALPPSSNRRLWFVMDELAKLRYLPTLELNITLLRKYGGCVLAATQSFKQLFAYYGKNSGSIMLGQFNTNVIFKVVDSEDAQIIAKRVGNIEILQQQKNTSYGAHEHRDGISYTEQQRFRSLIEASDIANLEPGEAYVLLPEPEVAISKIKTKKAIVPGNIQPDFIGEIPAKMRVEQVSQDSTVAPTKPSESSFKKIL